MDIEVVKELINSFKEAGLTSLSLKSEEFELKLGKEEKKIVTPMQQIPVSQPAVGTAIITQGENTQGAAQTDTKDKEMAGQKTIVSPMVGTFYAASNPKAEPLVTIGSKVKKGDVVCIIEAMKLMNEVEADVEGEIVEILVENEEMVEYNQPLFILK